MNIKNKFIKQMCISCVAMIFINACSFAGKDPNDNSSQIPFSAEQISTSEPQNENSIPTPTPSENEKEPLSVFATQIIDKNSNRMDNINLALKAINGKVICIGKEFSFNAATGKRSFANGYLEAPVIVNEKKEMGIGGGICQVSTTLFNAAELAGMDITERYSHSVNVSYVEEGRDATVVYGLKDLKFINNTEKNVKIEAKIENDTVVVKFWDAN